MIDDDELDALSAAWHQGHGAYQAGEPVGVNPYRLGLARDYWLGGWQTAHYEARPPEIKPQRRWGDAAEAARRPPLCSATISSTKMEAKGKKPRPPEARSLRWIPEALEVSGLTRRQ